MKKMFWVLFLSINLYGQDLPRAFTDNALIPRWVKKEFVSRRLYRDYSITFQMSPSFIRGDFNGDKRRDCAFLIQEKSSQKLGIAIFHTTPPQALHTQVVYIIGAGKSIADFGDNIRWANFWRTYPRNEASGDIERRVLVPILKADAIHLEKRGKKRGLLFWNGRKYVWHQLK